MFGFSLTWVYGTSEAPAVREILTGAAVESNYLERSRAFGAKTDGAPISRHGA
jgi:hypothetical protein